MDEIETLADVVGAGVLVATMESSMLATLSAANHHDKLGLTEAQIASLARELAKNTAQPVLMLEVKIGAR